jgi:anti-sigma regulatory factor (Ser/Thr protein kinase)
MNIPLKAGQRRGVADQNSTLELSMAAEPASVRLLRTEVLRWLHDLRVGDDTLAAAVALATSEAVGNVVRHAYAGEGGRVELDAHLRDDDILIRVADRGLGLSARSGTRTGLGLPVIGRVSNGVTVSSDAEGTTVSMRFALRTAKPRALGAHRFQAGQPMISIG